MLYPDIATKMSATDKNMLTYY